MLKKKDTGIKISLKKDAHGIILMILNGFTINNLLRKLYKKLLGN